MTTDHMTVLDLLPMLIVMIVMIPIYILVWRGTR